MSLLYFALMGDDFELLTSSSPIEHYYFSTNFDLHYNSNLIYDTKSSVDYSNCKLCSFIVRNTKANSTPKDVVITCSIGKVVSAIVFIKTLRTTGSKAKCVFLLDDDAYKGVSNLTRQIITECGGIMINCGVALYTKIFDAKSYCLLFAFEFLKANRGKFDRVVICDLFDTAFQGDPFSEQFSLTKLNIVDEGARLSHYLSGVPNFDWIKKQGFEPKDRSFKYYCAGYLGATQELFIKALTIFFEELKFNQGQADQGIFNYLVLTGIYERNGIYTTSERPNEEVRHLALVRLNGKKEIGYATCINNESAYAAVIHHYYNIRAFKDSLLRACPKELPELENYINERPGYD